MTVLREDGFEALQKSCRPQRRALVLSDPSYEIKTDYAASGRAIADGRRSPDLPPGPTCLVPDHPRPEARPARDA